MAGGVFTSTASGQQAGEEGAESSKPAHLKEQTWAADTDAKYPGQSWTNPSIPQTFIYCTTSVPGAENKRNTVPILQELSLVGETEVNKYRACTAAW